jgi:hypothetical protein
MFIILYFYYAYTTILPRQLKYFYLDTKQLPISYKFYCVIQVFIINNRLLVSTYLMYIPLLYEVRIFEEKKLSFIYYRRLICVVVLQ